MRRLGRHAIVVGLRGLGMAMVAVRVVRSVVVHTITRVVGRVLHGRPAGRRAHHRGRHRPLEG